MYIFKEKYKYLFILLFLFFFNNAFAQKEFNSWIFEDSCSLVFDNSQVLANTIPNEMQGNSAEICDKHTGQLLFYSNGIYVYDKNGNIMPNGSGLLGCYVGSQGALIVPNPADDSSYYLFTTDCTANGGYNGLNYNIVNMRLNDGLGDVEKKNVYVCNNLSEKVTAVRTCSFNGFWIITYVNTLNDFFAWRLTINGIDIDSPVISPSGFVGYPDIYDDDGCLKASPNGNMLIAGFAPHSDTCAYLYNFNKSTGIISIQTKIPWSTIPDKAEQYDFGVSFSPDNSKVYFTNIRDGISCNLYQYDLTTGIVTFIYQNNPKTNNGVFGLQLGPDGRIYIANSNFDSVGVISQPNLAGLACDFNVDGVSVSPHTMFASLPNNIDALYYTDTLFTPNFSFSTNCGDSSATFTDNSNITPYEWWWSFGDAASGSNNHSTLQNPTHHYTQPGTYTVTMNAYEGCASVDSIAQTVTISKCPPALIIPTLIYGGGSQTKWHIINLPQGANSVTLYNELGQVIYNSLNYPNDYDMRVLPSAMYFYRLMLENGEVYVGKIILVK